MKKIHNPFAGMDDGTYRCFGCSPLNDPGLKLEFWENGDEIVAHWMPDKKYQGFSDILHGGIQATLMDEAASWFVFAKCGTSGVTSEMQVKYLRPLFISKGEITITARLLQETKRICTIACTISDKAGVEYANGEIKYFIFPLEVAKAKYKYPGIKAFSGE